jgi:hypothetical protein
MYLGSQRALKSLQGFSKESVYDLSRARGDKAKATEEAHFTGCK